MLLSYTTKMGSVISICDPGHQIQVKSRIISLYNTRLLLHWYESVTWFFSISRISDSMLRNSIIRALVVEAMLTFMSVCLSMGRSLLLS